MSVSNAALATFPQSEVKVATAQSAGQYVTFQSDRNLVWYRNLVIGIINLTVLNT